MVKTFQAEDHIFGMVNGGFIVSVVRGAGYRWGMQEEGEYQYD